MTGFMPPGMNFPGMPSATPHWNPFGNLNSPAYQSAGMDWMGQAQQFYQMLQQAMGSLPDVRQIDVAGVADMWRKAMSDAMATARPADRIHPTMAAGVGYPRAGIRARASGVGCRNG
jgi:hypothetical protein